jgi:hypothetical protein
MDFNPILVEANEMHYLCVPDRDRCISVYEIRLATGNILFVDDWAPMRDLNTVDEFRAYCEQVVKDNPIPF